jgi:hypothetical protein
MSVVCKLAEAEGQEGAEAAMVAELVDVSLPEEEGQGGVVAVVVIFTLVLIHLTNGQRYPMKINSALETVALHLPRANSKPDQSAPSLLSQMRAMMMPYQQ